MLGNGYGFNWQGLYVTSLLDAHSAWRERADELSDTLKTHDAARALHGHALPRPLLRQGAEPRPRLRAAYDAVLADYDLLLMPTLPMVATPCPTRTRPIAEILARAFEMLPTLCLIG